VEAKGSGLPCFIPYLTAGLPGPEGFIELCLLLRGLGAPILEIGLPFSDPVLDGPVLQRANQMALQGGMDTERVFSLIREIRKATDETAVVLMSYLNPVYRYGIQNFMERAKDSGVDGIIIADCPVEESGLWIDEARVLGLDTVFLISPNSGPQRLKAILEVCTGFLYYTTLKGTTGARDMLPEGLAASIKQTKAHCRLPVAAGFGISKRSHWDQLKGVCDGIIVGSALMELVISLPAASLLKKVEGFVKDLLGL
jgi:tryptophan synthase alpha chain